MAVVLYGRALGESCNDSLKREVGEVASRERGRNVDGMHGWLGGIG